MSIVYEYSTGNKMSERTQLLNVTENVIRKYGHTTEDIEYIGDVRHRHGSKTWEGFTSMEDIEKLYGLEDHGGLKIIFKDGTSRTIVVIGGVVSAD